MARTPAAALIPVGAELQVNTYTPYHQRYPAVAGDADGDFVVVWESVGDQDGAEEGIFAQRFASSGTRVGGEFQVNSYTSYSQQRPAVTMDADGDFVVVWLSDGQDGDSLGVFGRRFSSAGVALATELQVNSYTSSHQEHAAIAISATGQFIVVWDSSGGQDGEGGGVFAQRFASSGARVGGELQVNVYTSGPQSVPAVAIDAESDFVVAWQSSNDFDGYGGGIAARRFSSAGTALGGDFQVNSYTISHETDPVIGMDAAGAFVIAWESQGDHDGDGRGVFAQRFASNADRLGDEFQVNTVFTGGQAVPSLAMNASGSFIVAWHSDVQDGSSANIAAQRYSSAGNPVASELEVNTFIPNDQEFATVALAADGDFVIAWQSYGQDEPSSDGVFAQLFAGAPALDVDGDGETQALTDGLLVVRLLFGFSGATLIAGAVDTIDCKRCTAPEIEAYLAAIDDQLDIDGDGGSEALTDGLLVLRWLFGFTDATLVNGAFDAMDCTRCTADDIEDHLSSLDG